MADVVDKETRSRMMSGIRGKDTRPELLIRRMLHSRGYRYRLHDSSLPGKPDLVFPKYGAVILVNGCFWHGHNCHLFKWPSTRQDFWREKISRTREKDEENIKRLRQDGWRVLEIWECATKGKHRLAIEEIIDRTELWLQSANERACIAGLEVERTSEKRAAV